MNSLTFEIPGQICAALCLSGCLCILIYASVKKVLGSLNVVIQAAPVSIAVFYLAIPVGACLMLLDYILILVFGEHPFKIQRSEESEILLAGYVALLFLSAILKESGKMHLQKKKFSRTILSGSLPVRTFLQNDSPCKVCAPYLAEIGINLLNFGIQHTINEMKTWTDNKITPLGNIPPRDVLAIGTPEDIEKNTTELIESLHDRSRLILSCGGGMPPEVSSDNIRAFITAVETLTRE